MYTLDYVMIYGLSIVAYANFRWEGPGMLLHQSDSQIPLTFLSGSEREMV